MGERGSRKIPVTEREFLWVQDDDKGEVVLHVGPTMVSPTAADRIVVDDGQGGFMESTTGRPQRMIELSDSQYAVLYNPLLEPDGGINGRFKSGRNESRPLKNGTRHMIPGPCSFWLRPGQRVEVRDAHELASNQYLVVKVYGEVDTQAPYYEITARSAAITSATSEDVHDSSTSTRLDDVDPVALTRGQLIVIRGLDTQFYTPPTGVDVVPDLSVDPSGAKLTAEAARKLLRSLPTKPPVPTAVPAEAPIQQQAFASNLVDNRSLAEAIAEEAEEEERKERKKLSRRHKVEQAARFRNQVQRAAPAPPAPEPKPRSTVSTDDLQMILENSLYRQELEREVRKARLIRQAVVLGEKEFCVILDADGKRQIKVGPARVFPGPYDSFMTTGSDKRIYYAYELLPQRGLWLRFISTVSREKLARKLPRGVELGAETYYPGDELILTGVNSFFFPFNEIEILHPMTGQPHVGNDHSTVFIEAIGIDQKSGIYVRDLATGEARLVRGKQSYLVDPRKEVHITRNIPTKEWNQWIASVEPHKSTRQSITTPWAVSITVPHNTAVMATSATGQRVIEGPCVELLEYEEALVSLSLSTGTPKDDDHRLETCYLRTVGNRVSDILHVETMDFVRVNIQVSYRVTFDPSYKDRWFNHVNYIQVLCDHLRSLVRSRCRQINLTELWPTFPTMIRDTILGERTEEGRKGRFFEENGMLITEVEILGAEILDEDIANLLSSVQKSSVSRQINDQQARERLKSEELLNTIETERVKLQRETQQRQSELQSLIHTLQHAAKRTELEASHTLKTSALQAENTLEKERLLAKLDRERTSLELQLETIQREADAEAYAIQKQHLEEIEHKTKLHQLELALIQAQSSATVAERNAVQPALVEAMTGLGDKILLTEVAQNMNLISLFKGKDIGSILSDVVGGSKLGRTLQNLTPKTPKSDT